MPYAPTKSCDSNPNLFGPQPHRHVNFKTPCDAYPHLPTKKPTCIPLLPVPSLSPSEIARPLTSLCNSLRNNLQWTNFICGHECPELWPFLEKKKWKKQVSLGSSIMNVQNFPYIASTTYCNTSVLTVRSFGFSTYIASTIYLDVVYIQVHDKNYVWRHGYSLFTLNILFVLLLILSILYIKTSLNGRFHVLVSQAWHHKWNKISQFQCTIQA